MRRTNLRNWHAVGWLVLLCVAAVLMATTAAAQTPPALTFTLEAKSADGATVAPKLTWSTTPAATSCTASGDWSGVKLHAGTETLASVTSSKAYTLVCNWPGDLACTVRWVPPTTNVGGSNYTNPGGFRVQYGRVATDLDQSVYIQNPAATTWQCPATLTAGTWFFGVRAYNAQGLESALTAPPASKLLTVSQSVTRALNLGFSIPSSPTAVTAE